MNKYTKIEISTNSILKLLFILAGLYVLYLIRNIVFIFIIIFVLDAAFSPVVDSLEKQKIPRLAGTIIVYLFMLAILVAFSFLIFPPLAAQVTNIANNAPDIINSLMPLYNKIVDFSYHQTNIINLIQQSLQSLSSQVGNLGTNFVSATLGVFSGIVSVLVIAILLFYLLLEKNSFAKSVVYFLPKSKQNYYLRVANKISLKWGDWFRGQILISIVMGIVVGIGLKIIGVPYALTLGVIAAFTEFIPVLGPILGAIPAVIIALTVNPWIGLIVLIFYIVVQQLENYILVPKIMQKTVGLSPVVIILAILIGGQLFGLLGVLLAIPIAAGLMVIFTEWKEENQKKNR